MSTETKIVGIRVGAGTKVHATYSTGSHEVRRFGRVEIVEDFGLPLCGCSIWTKRGGFGSVFPVSAPVNCERCLSMVSK